ncbi:MAG: bifunctional 4-hydroxy-2-oxoglutarate aldolase/2-dehydro-3-deoxy-phosphogluconate aldolase, partial [Bacteroidota bacterium]
MHNQEQVSAAIIQQGMLPLYFNADAHKSVAVMRAIYQAGIRAMEYTNRGAAAYENFKLMVEVRNLELKDLMLGVGTIKTMPDAGKFMDAGADFLVSPGLVKNIARFAVINKFFYAPGCMTPSEINSAENIGIKFIKLFPGNLLGPEFLSSIREIFPALHVMPTGGVEPTAESIGAWFKAGVSAVGMGSKLVSKKLMETDDYS